MNSIYDLGTGCPLVQDHEGRVLLWGDAHDEGKVGFRMSVEGATTLALRLLAEVSRLRDGDLPVTPASAFVIDKLESDGREPVYRIGFVVDEATIAVQLDADQFSDTAAAFAAQARDNDLVKNPRPDL